MQDDEEPLLSVVEDKMKEGALKEAKYNYIAGLMSSSELKNAGLADIKAGIEGAIQRTVTVKASGSNISGIGGNETEAVGRAFGTPSGKITAAPFKGLMLLFFMK